MSPNIPYVPSGVLHKGQNESETIDEQNPKNQLTYKLEIVWRNVIIFILLHAAALYGVYLSIFYSKIVTTLFTIFVYQLSGLGITAGAHRLWAHRSYKAKWPLRLFLTFCNTLALQDAALHWARDHRVHHKYSETDADPHDARRGFFFAHVGWLLCKKHHQVKIKGKQIDMSDLYSDPILQFQKKYYLPLVFTVCIGLPTVIPVMCWNETWSNAFFCPAILRYVFTLNATWLVNSAAHMFGNKPYDRHINPAENKTVAILAMGEGWHNYHHVFPWDYKTAELGNYSFNFTTAFIDFCHKIGLAYDLKTVKEDVVRSRVERTGDGTHNTWGWGDKDQTEEEKEGAIIINHKNHSQ